MEKQAIMEARMKVLAYVTVFATTVATCAEEGEGSGNPLYNDYIARRDAYNVKAEEVRREFLAIENFEWKFVIDKHPTFVLFALNPPPYDGKSHVELYGEAKAFAEKYTAEELANGLWELNEAPLKGVSGERLIPPPPGRLWINLTALAHAKGGLDAYTRFPRWPDSAQDAAKIIGSKYSRSPRYFSGFDFNLVSIECAEKIYPQPIEFSIQTANSKGNKAYAEKLQKAMRDRENPAQRRQEYIEAIEKILSDPNMHKENPKETKNLQEILATLNMMNDAAIHVKPDAKNDAVMEEE